MASIIATMNNYYFVDGSALLGDITRVRRDLGLSNAARFDLSTFVTHFTGMNYASFNQGHYRRFVLYFVENDERLRGHVIIPDATKPGAVNDMRIEYCGKRISQFARAQQLLEQSDAPDFVRECFYRSEKAVDTQICCDALQLAGTGKLDRLFLYTNDYDFLPLFRALRQLGANINIFRLRANGMNAALASECDALHEMPEQLLRSAFVLPPEAPSGDASGG